MAFFLIRALRSRSILLPLLLPCLGSALLVDRPIPPSQTGNTYQDLNGDGRLDAITITLLGDVDKNYLNSELDSVQIQWINTIGTASWFGIPGSAFEQDPTDTRKIHYHFADPSPFYPFLTSIDTARFGAFGAAKLYASAKGKPNQVFPLHITDDMGPVIREASLLLASNEDDEDRLILTLSEPISIVPAPLFTIKAADSTSIHLLRYSAFSQSSPTELVLRFGKDIRYAQRPSSNDSISLQVPHKQANPFRVIQGDFRFAIKSVSMGNYSGDKSPDPTQDPIELKANPAGTPTTGNPSVAMIVEMGSPDLLHSVQRAIREAYYPYDSSLLAENIAIQLAKIRIYLELSIFTNMGGFVAKRNAPISCQDELFEGNCIRNPRQIILQWNHQSQEGRWVNSGAYLANMKLIVRYEGAQAVEVSRREKLESWGILRQ